MADEGSGPGVELANSQKSPISLFSYFIGAKNSKPLLNDAYALPSLRERQVGPGTDLDQGVGNVIATLTATEYQQPRIGEDPWPSTRLAAVVPVVRVCLLLGFSALATVFVELKAEA
jgi:hypothetical protein